MYYIVQSLFSDGKLIYEKNFDNEHDARNLAAEFVLDHTFEGDLVRIITSDGELIKEVKIHKIENSTRYGGF